MHEMQQNLEAAAREVSDLLTGESGPVNWLELVRQLDVVERIAHGGKLQALARADGEKSARAGIGAWLTAELGYGNSRARGLAEEARRIGTLPELAEKLTAGQLNQDQTRVVDRAVKAVNDTGIDATETITETLEAIERDGITKARARIRVLEETLAPGHVKDLNTRQRARCFLRTAETEEGMVRIDALLDAQRGTLLRAALDHLVSGWIRTRQYDDTEQLPEDVATVEQLGAQALVRLAEVYLTATDQQRGAHFIPPALYYLTAPMRDSAANSPAAGPVRDLAADPGPSTPQLPEPPQIPAGCALTVYGDLVPAEGLPPMRDPAARVLTVDPETGDPVALDGRPLDADPAARLASPDQRQALAFRDRYCTEPGCSRPVTWALHAHHETAFKDGGATSLWNMALLCSAHHILRHHPGHRLAA